MPKSETFELRKSSIHGMGLFALCDISEGTDLFITHMRDPNWAKDMPDNWYGWINLKPNCMYNHSDSNANCISKTEGKIKILVAQRSIKNGDELLVDYTKDNDLEQPKENWNSR
jgi:hypothetical protein